MRDGAGRNFRGHVPCQAKIPVLKISGGARRPWLDVTRAELQHFASWQIAEMASFFVSGRKDLKGKNITKTKFLSANQNSSDLVSSTKEAKPPIMWLADITIPPLLIPPKTRCVELCTIRTNKARRGPDKTLLPKMNSAQTINTNIANKRAIFVKLPPAKVCETSANPSKIKELITNLGDPPVFSILEA